MLAFYKDELDPDSVSRDSKYDTNFHIEIYFEDTCSKCNSYTPIEKICENCKKNISKEIVNWVTMHNLLKVYFVLNSIKIAS